MTAVIYRPAKGATQAGRGKTKAWRLDLRSNGSREIEPLMGWTSTDDTSSQVQLSFDTKEEAIAFAEKKGIVYQVEEPAPDVQRAGLSYSDNFKSTRLGQWTH